MANSTTSSSSTPVVVADANSGDNGNNNNWKDTLFFWQGDLVTTKTRIEYKEEEQDAVDDIAATRRSISIRDAVWQGTRISTPHCPDARCAATPIRFPLLINARCVCYNMT
jgi:hypothetical protein